MGFEEARGASCNGKRVYLVVKKQNALWVCEGVRLVTASSVVIANGSRHAHLRTFEPGNSFRGKRKTETEGPSCKTEQNDLRQLSREQRAE
jgi:hypothetical protein